jgi:5-methylcytosine-specific restriction enzyme A
MCDEEGLVEEATEVDHIIPKAQGGLDEESNLQSLCKPHHSAKTAREVFHGGEPSRLTEKGGG